jgi:ABC-type glycerol-3-phosphate transport system substrate-binding protein
MRRSGALLLMALPGIIHLFVFSYLPMPELLLAFKDYKFARGIWGSAWVEFRNFQFLFATGDAWRIIFNTLFLNTLFILTTLVGALTMAVLLLVLAACSTPAAPGAQQPSDSSAASSSAAPASSAAAQAPNGDAPTLDYYYVATSARSEDLQQVEDAMNAILVPKIGAKLKLRPLAFAEITTKAPLILQSGEKCDLMAMSGFNPYNNGVATGGLLALDELLPQHAPKTWASHPAEIWNAARINGKIYGSVNDTGWGGFTGMWARQDLLDKYKFDYAKTTRVEEWEPYFDQILANEPGVTPFISTDGYWGRTWFANYYGYDPIDTSIGAPQSQGAIGVKVDDASRKVVVVAFTPEYKQAVELACGSVLEYSARCCMVVLLNQGRYAQDQRQPPLFNP